MLRVRAPRRTGGGREGERMTTTVDTDLYGAVEDAAAHLYVWALKDIPQDLRDARRRAGEETSTTGRRVLDVIHRNISIADEEKNLVCQDTGIAVYTCRVGEGFPLHPARIYQALKAGTERATIEHPLRSNAVHTITRENTGPNTGHRLPIVHWEFIPDWDGLDVKCVPKGSGSENMSFLKMCVPADGVKGIKQFVLESIVGAAASRACLGSSASGSAAPRTTRCTWRRRRSRGPLGRATPTRWWRNSRRSCSGSSTRRASGPWGSAATSPCSSATSSTPTRT